MKLFLVQVVVFTRNREISTRAVPTRTPMTSVSTVRATWRRRRRNRRQEIQLTVNLKTFYMDIYLCISLHKVYV
jgi:hypothetical protein